MEPKSERMILKQLSDIQKAIPVIGKDQKNTQQNYNFRGIDDIYNTLTGIFADNQVLILPRILESKNETIQKGDKYIFKTFYIVEFTFLSLIDGSRESISMAGEGLDYSDKTTGKAMSNAYKYALCEMFLIPTEDINDSDQSTEKEGNEIDGARKAAKLALEKGNYPEAKKKAMIAGLKNYDIVFLEKIINGQV